MTNTALKTSSTVAALNDRFRRTFVGGIVVTTRGIHSLGPVFVTKMLVAVRGYSNFDEDNDPHGEHDFGSLTIEGCDVFWKIDCFDQSMRHRSEDPANQAITRRVLTIMLAEEY